MPKIWLRTISILEIGGGVFGIIILIWWFLVSPFNIYSLSIAPIPIAVYILSMLAGYGLWRGNRFGRTASIIVQIIQLPKIFSSLIIFVFSLGFDVWFQLLILDNGLSNFGIEFRFLAFNQLFFAVETVPTGIGVSITALVFLIILINYKPQSFTEDFQGPPQPPTFEQNREEQAPE